MLEPTANNTSDSCNHLRAGRLVELLPAPRARGCRSSKDDLPGMVQYAGISVSSASSLSSSVASANSTPIPDQITGFLAFNSRLAASLTSLAAGDWGDLLGGW